MPRVSAFGVQGFCILIYNFDHEPRRAEINQFREINRLQDHKERVYQVSFSSDGNLIASASEDKSVRLWKADGSLITPLFGHQAEVVSIAFNPGSTNDKDENGVRIKRQMLASGSYDETVKLWQIGTDLDGPNQGRIRASLFKTLINDGHPEKVYSVTSDPGGTMLASASADGSVKLWSWEGELLQTLQHGELGTVVTGVSFRLYSNEIATAGIDGRVKRWTKGGKLLATLKQDSSVLSLSYSPDGKQLASGDAKGVLKLWQLDGTSKTLQKHEAAIWRIIYSQDGQTIATASGDGTVRLWRPDGKLTQTLRGHQGAVYRVQFSLDGRIIATASADGTIRLWTEDGTLLDSLEGHRDEVLGIDFSPPNSSQRILASASADSTVRLWKLESPVKVLPHRNRVFDVVFRSDSNLLASSSWNTIKLWNRDGTLVKSENAHEGKVSSIDFSDGLDTGLLASTGFDPDALGKPFYKIKLWRTGGSGILPVATVAEQPSEITRLKFLPGHPLLASISEDGKIQFWQYLKNNESDKATELKGKLVYAMDAEQGQLTSLSFSPDGTKMVTTSKAQTGRGGQWKLWKLEFDAGDKPTLTLLKSGEEPQQVDLLCADFSPDGTEFATAGTDGTLRLWRSDGTAIKTLPVKHEKPITSVKFSPNGRLIASASQDGEIKLWKRKGELVSTLIRHRREVSSLSFSSDGKTLASASYDLSVVMS